MRSDVVALIRAKQAEIAKLQAELDEARAALAGRALEAAPSKRAPVGTVKQRPKTLSRRRRGASEVRGAEVLPGGSAASHAANAIKAAGRPLHVRDLLRAMEEEVAKIKATTLVGSLSRWVNRRVFYRAGPNVFGLAEMRKG
jgi:hypothetical protein